MTQREVLARAVEYFHNGTTMKRPAEAYKLHPSLQYRLCMAHQRLQRWFGEHEITMRMIAPLLEAWVMAQGTKRPAKPIAIGWLETTDGPVAKDDA